MPVMRDGIPRPLSSAPASFGVRIRNEGKFSRMEKELGLSYPTLRNRLRSIIQAMGFQPAEEEEEGPQPTPEERRRILDDLEKGRITVEEALRLLRGESPSQNQKA